MVWRNVRPSDAVRVRPSGRGREERTECLAGALHRPSAGLSRYVNPPDDVLIGSVASSTSRACAIVSRVAAAAARVFHKIGGWHLLVSHQKRQYVADGRSCAAAAAGIPSGNTMQKLRERALRKRIRTPSESDHCWLTVTVWPATRSVAVLSLFPWFGLASISIVTVPAPVPLDPLLMRNQPSVVVTVAVHEQ